MLHYTTSGDENHAPILFLHGFLGAGHDWHPYITQLQGTFRCIAVDLPGHGRSLGCDTQIYSFSGCAEAIIAILDQINVQHCNVVGYSMGGRIALYLAHRSPDRFPKIVLESASPGLETEAERWARRDHDDRLAHELETGDFDTFLERWYAQPLFQTLPSDPERLERIIAQRRRNDPRDLAKALRGLSTGRQPSLWNDLSAIDVPMLLVVGEYDAKFQAIAQRMVKLHPEAQMTVVPDAGHNVHEEKPERFVQVVRAFLGEEIA